MTNGIILGKKYPLVALNFGVPSLGFLYGPDFTNILVRSKEEDPNKPALPRERGVRELFSEKPVHLVDVHDIILGNSYALVDANWRRSPTVQSPARVMISFMFCHTSILEPNEEFRACIPELNQTLESFITKYGWRLELYDNPYFKDGVTVEGRRMISIFGAFLHESQALCHDDGTPIMVVARDMNGRKVDGAPEVPKKPKVRLAYDPAVGFSIVPN